MNCREPIVVAGLDLAVAFFRALDREVPIERCVSDGEAVAAGTVLLRITGQCAGDACRRALGAQHAAASVGNRDA